MMSVLRNTFDNATGSIVTSKYCGELEDLKIAPLSRSQIAWAHGLGILARGMTVGVVTLAIGQLFYAFASDTYLGVAHPLLLLVFLALGGLAFAHLGMAVSMYSSSFDQISAINTFLLLPLIYLGGVFFSLEHLHPFWQMLSQANPILYLVNGVRYAVLGAADVSPWVALAVTTGTAGLFYGVALQALKKGTYGRW